MAHQTQVLTSFVLDKRPSPGMPLSQSMMYGSSGSHASSLSSSFSEFNEVWSSDSSSNGLSLRRWQDENRRSSAELTNRFHGAFLSDCRTTISSLDSPAFQPLLLPNENILPTHSLSNSQVPRGIGFIDSSPSTESDELPEPTASAQWHTWNFPYNGRTSPGPRLSRSSTGSPDWHGALNVQIPSFDPQSWNSMLVPAADSSGTPYTPQQAMSLNGFIFPHRFSPIPSPSPPPMYQDALSITPAKPHAHAPLSSHSSRDSLDVPSAVKKCSHCQATSTPLWRRDPSTFKPLCNACGLYLQQRNRLRPQELIDADTDDGNATDDSDQNYVGPECSHCRTHHTSVWRRSKTGAQLCNACGVYARLRGKPRPLSLKRNKIKPRSKHPKQ